MIYDWMGLGFAMPDLYDTEEDTSPKQNPDPVGYDCPTWKEVKLYVSPWAAGSAVLRHKGPLKLEFRADTLEEAIDQSEEQLMKEAFYMGANAVVGWERNIHLWENPILVQTGGSCVIQGNP